MTTRETRPIKKRRSAVDVEKSRNDGYARPKSAVGGRTRRSVGAAIGPISRRG
jgi:hypothetical protein